jgi:peptide/nickel transport system permease protein
VGKRAYFIRKIVNAMLTIILVASFNFFLFRIMPGDPARMLVPKGKFDFNAIKAQRKVFHLDKPVWEQFIYYWSDTAQLHFGNSFAEKRPVTQIISERIWATIILCGLGTLLANALGMVEGVFAGWRRGQPFDVATTDTSMVMYAMPTFWQCLLAIMFFSVYLGWFPVGREYTPLQHFHMFGPIPLDWSTFTTLLYHITLPVSMFALGYYGEYHLIMRSSLTGVMKEDYVLTARAKGLKDNDVLWRHVVPNALLPTVTLVLMNLGFVVSGAILVESVFNWPGIGLLSYTAMTSYDYPVMQAVFMLGSVAVIVANLVADILLYYIDPRVKA